MCRLTRPFALAFATYCVWKGVLFMLKRALMVISFSLFCGSCGKGMSRYMAYIAQKNRITPVSLTERIFRHRALNTYVLKYRSHQNLPGLLSKDWWRHLRWCLRLVWWRYISASCRRWMLGRDEPRRYGRWWRNGTWEPRRARAGSLSIR